MSRLSLGGLLLLGIACSSDAEWDKVAEASAARGPASSRAVAAGDVAPGGAPTGHAPAPAAAPSDSATVTVYKSPTCGCCSNWVRHMRESGFTVVAIDTSDVNAVRHSHGVGNDMGSCHTATVGGYVIEGHVPAADVKRLLTERPAIVGLAVPGMPMGSPGMEGMYSQRYDVLAFDRTGGRSVFASH